mmetsp:Transcript_32497/g.46188  ORF Transcript_32497/g.46188 Transcript_32497/m.46188 type:complete len:109 (+) Transcript_32497:21-347(+)
MGGSQSVVQYFALHICIHAHGMTLGETLREALKNAKDKLKRRILLGINHLETVHSAFYIDFVEDEEGQLCCNLRGCIKLMGQVQCGDEKAFQFTGRHICVHQVLSKTS